MNKLNILVEIIETAIHRLCMPPMYVCYMRDNCLLKTQGHSLTCSCPYDHIFKTRRRKLVARHFLHILHQGDIVAEALNIGQGNWHASHCQNGLCILERCMHGANKAVESGEILQARLVLQLWWLFHMVVIVPWPGIHVTTSVSHIQLRSCIQAPAARVQASISYWEEGNSLIVFGGRAKTCHFGDLHILNLDTWTWNQPAIATAGPSPRHSPAVHLHSNSPLYLLLRLHYNTETTW